MNAPAERVPAADAPPGLADLTSSLVRHGRNLAADYALLAVLDARSAAVRFGWLVAAGLVAGVLRRDRVACARRRRGRGH